MRIQGQAAGVGLRVFLAWWLLPSLVLGVLQPIFGVCLAFSLLPLLALAVAVRAVRLQLRGQRGAASLSAFHRRSLELPVPLEEAERELAGRLQDELGATRFALAEHRLMAEFAPPEWRGRWRRWLETDEVSVQLKVSGAQGCSAEVEARPLNGLIHRVFWVDAGRNHQRLERLLEGLRSWLEAREAQRNSEFQAESLEARLAKAELLLLRAQVEPHFLFNTLAHLRVLIAEQEQALALRMLDALIAHARRSSRRLGQATLPLGEELEGVRSYLDLVQLRFGDRLAVALQVAEGLEACPVPVGCLLIPVENAIKHGVERRGTGAHLEVRARQEYGTLHLEVLDNGPGLGADPGFARGSGLKNLRERLALSYGSAFQLGVEDQEGGGVRVHLGFPAALPTT